MSHFLNSVQRLLNDINRSLKPLKNTIPFDYTQGVPAAQLPPFLKTGNLISITNNLFPALLPLNHMKGIAFSLNDSNREEVHLAIQHYILQILSYLNGYATIDVVDIKHMGKNFRSFRRLDKKYLTNFVTDEEGLKNLIDYHYNKSVSVIAESTGGSHNLSEHNAKSEHKLPFRILAIADFPHGFKNTDKFESLLQNAQETGLLTFLSFSPYCPVNLISPLWCFEEFGEAVNDYYRVLHHEKRDNVVDKKIISVFNHYYTFKLDRKDVSIDNINEQINLFAENDSVESDRLGGIRIPIGKRAGQTHSFTLGYESDNFHAIIGGQSGKGKTVLLNNVIAKGIETYTSNELQFIVIDCSGTGFQEFENAPGIQLMCRSSSVETCMEAIRYIEQELLRREALFQEHGVDNLKKYVTKTGKPLPRLICLIDEFHVLYSGKERDSVYIDNILVSRVIRIGRKFGVHLVVCTQSLGSGVRRSILDNIPLRIALGMTSDQSTGFLGLGNNAAANLERGVAIYNSQNGNFSSNALVKINYISEEDIKQSIAIAIQKNRQLLTADKIAV